MTTHFSTHLRRPVALLAGLSLVVGLFVITPAPTTAQTTDPAPDYLASFDACPGDVIPDSSFRDVSSRHPNVDDIDCIAYYAITMGTSATTFGPEDPVIREHMALFLVRMAKRVGIDLPPPDSFTPFTDIGDLSQESQEAIAQIYQLRITIGTSETTYAPKKDVNRGEMALFLSRLMNRMDPVADGRVSYGYIPDDVDDNIGRYDIDSPYTDLNTVSVEAYDAVTNLFELGVGSGVSSSLYGPSRDMSRAAMAEFMAGILDHSNLRPEGAMVQVTPTNGLDNFDITMMISVRDPEFTPVDNQPVDWFYSADEDGGLDRGVCVDDFIQPANADCLWTLDDDDTDREGNIFLDRIEATPGATMTFYTWIGRRDREEFDDRAVDFSSAQAHSAMGPSSIDVTWRERDIPPNALVVEGAYVVDLNIDSIDFTIQLRDEEGNNLELAGIEIEVDVDSRDMLLDSTALTATNPRPDPSINSNIGGRSESNTTLLTDDDGEAFFELFAPRRDQRLDAVTFRPDCDRCDPYFVDVAWTEEVPVLVSARPQFNLYSTRSGSTARLQVRYQLYDQYGERISGVAASRTGRSGTTAKATLAYGFYSVADQTATTAAAEETAPTTPTALSFSGRTVSESIPTGSFDGFFLVLQPSVFSDSDSQGDKGSLDSTEIRYLPDEDNNGTEDPVVVWFVTPATGNSDLKACEFAWTGIDAPDTPRIEVNPDQREFRTCFSLWSYDSNDRFLVDNADATLEEFEQRLRSLSNDEYGDLSIFSYSTSSRVRSIFQISS